MSHRSPLSLRIGVPLVLLVLMVAGTAIASTAPPDTVRDDRDNHRGIVLLPLARYATETRGGLGIRVLTYFNGSAGRASTLTGSFLYTQENQMRAFLEADVHSPAAKLEFKTEFEFWNTPLHFYGLGPDAPAGDDELYTPERARFYAELFRFITDSFKVGVRYEYETVDLVDLDPEGQLIGGDIRGSAGADISGIGMLAAHDTRDDGFSPGSGAYHELYLLVFNEELGSDHDFKNYIVDLKWYRTIGPSRVLAWQLFTYGVTEFAPFHRLAALGGREHSRGYRRARYLDQILVAAQAELRQHLVGRLGFVGFLGVAEVTDSFGRLSAADIKPTAGAGLRFRPRESTRIKIRLDAAFGLETPRLYLSLQEAF